MGLDTLLYKEKEYECKKYLINHKVWETRTVCINDKLPIQVNIGSCYHTYQSGGVQYISGESEDGTILEVRLVAYEISEYDFTALLERLENFDDDSELEELDFFTM